MATSRPDIPSRNFQVQKDKVIVIKDKDDLHPHYTGVTYLCTGQVMLAEIGNKRVFLLDSSFNSTSSYKLPNSPDNVCVVDDDDEVDVTFPWEKTVQFLSVRNGKITPTRAITTRYSCHGVAAAGKGKIVVSGPSDYVGKHYWSLISSGGKDEYCCLFDCQCSYSWTSVTLDSSFTCLYLIVNLASSLYCFDMSGSQKFVYNHDHLKGPRGVATDKYDNVYVVGYISGNIHHLTPDGIVLQIIYDGLPDTPTAICFNRDGDEFLVTDETDNTLHKYRLK